MANDDPPNFLYRGPISLSHYQFLVYDDGVELVEYLDGLSPMTEREFMIHGVVGTDRIARFSTSSHHHLHLLEIVDARELDESTHGATVRRHRIQVTSGRLAFGGILPDDNKTIRLKRGLYDLTLLTFNRGVDVSTLDPAVKEDVLLHPERIAEHPELERYRLIVTPAETGTLR